ncbi:IS630-like element ISMsm2 family transposase [Virgibacillus siamensis]|uniref:IS630-like element ISMsm2 family transposase n=1 Tax=Virgibacillus siamensis TaxID=480071 RepID=A0ABN1FMF3_9BACI
MPFKRTKAELILTQSERDELNKIIKTRTEEFRRVERAKMMLLYADGEQAPAIADQLNTNAPKVYRCIDKALEFGALNALDDIKRSGRPAQITDDAKTWVVSLACQKPKELGYSYEVWTTRFLSQHIRKNAEEAGHPSVKNIGSGTVSRILDENDIKPHKINYYLERRDPDFDTKMAQVLYVYQQVQWTLEDNEFQPICDVMLSYDEKPGIQAVENKAPDLPPVPGKHTTIGRDSEYIRHGTLSLLAGIDLVTGEVIGSVEDRHRSREFVDFLKMLDDRYDPELRIQVVLDNHSAHTSKETRAYLETVPNRFEFVFTPKHGSWLNIIESFFAKMSKSFLRHIRVKSKQELKERIELYLQEVNENPVPFRWKYGLESASN